MDLEKRCAVCRNVWTGFVRCPSCDQLNCPRSSCGSYDLHEWVDVSKVARDSRWLCSHCVEEVLYGP